MTVVAVNGTSIQAAHDKAQAGDTLNLAAGGYAGWRGTKKLNYRGDGVVIEGPTNTVQLASSAAGSTFVGAMSIRGSTGENNACLLVKADDVFADGLTFEQGASHGVRAYSNRLHLQHVAFKHLGCAAELNTKAAGSIIEDFTVDQMDRMVTIDWGGTGFNLWANAGPVIFRRGTMEGCRAASTRYGHDGGAFAAFNGAKNVTIEDVSIHDALTIYEDGGPSGSPANAGWTWRRVTGKGDAAKVTDQWWVTPTGTSNKGFLIRDTQDVLIEDCQLINLDGWYFNLTQDSRWAGSVERVNLLNNRLVHKAGDNRAYLVRAGINPAEITVNNTIQRSPDLKYTAYNEALKGNTNDLAAFKKWGLNVGAGESWGSLEMPLEQALRERDEARKALADCEARVA